MVDFKEFLIKTAVVIEDLEDGGNGRAIEYFKTAFKKFDENGDGYITSDELESVLTKLVGEKYPEEEIADILQQVDANGDGKITLEGKQKYLSLKICF